MLFFVFFFQAEDGIRDFCLSRGLGDVYKRQATFQQEPAQEEGFKFPSLLTVHQEAEMEKQKEEDFVKEKNFDSFDNLNSVFCCSQTSKKIDKKVKRNESKFKSLAIRNIKCNFAASLENFIEFLMQKNLLQCNPAKKFQIHGIEELHSFVIKIAQGIPRVEGSLVASALWIPCEENFLLFFLELIC
eukprot:TRINITY_DN4648_c0_g1_i3.p1 TRINITY_DN4648_c0_g1~~TRINITY_DN4648_c0_g1_i3.p1  ORF type:complete len:187 (+),score=29.99 TRINITY_DN4648_c0_g1_i3:60-620(+)